MITVEEVKTYVKVKDELYKSCEKWAKNHLENWQHYSGFKVSDDIITIEYRYKNFWDNSGRYTEYDSIRVPLNEVLQCI
jgi:hypothetical protein